MLILNIQGEIMINNSPSSITDLELKNIKAVVFKAAEAYTNSDLKIDFDNTKFYTPSNPLTSTTDIENINNISHVTLPLSIFFL